MNNLISYFKNSYEELMYKVTWPSFASLQNSAVLVIIASLLIAAAIWIMDFGSRNLMDLIYDALK